MAEAWMELLRRELKRRTGVLLEPGREPAIVQRLAGAARARGLADPEALVRRAFDQLDLGAQTLVLDAMMNHETSFFRDRAPFEEFRKTILPTLLDARAGVRRLRIWSAACATGQEPYSLAMVLDEEARRLKGWEIEIVATDVSEAALNVAREGFYNQFEVQRGLPVSQLLRYFSREGDRWRIAEHIRASVDFRQSNLLRDLSRLGSFDLVLCRNVLIYFDLETKKQVLERLAGALSPDGVLLLGAAESTIGLSRSLAAAPNRPWLCWRREQDQPRLRLVN
ncbi:MAG TPA: protein-glutamate O-methyltransferase CheR [Beijerinckiaceae bacterium]|jgi:chemotaxis protein methyltransferase CheR